MPTKTKKKDYTETWVVYVRLNSSYATFPDETYWERFETKEKAEKWYKAQAKHPRLKEIEKPRVYKVYQLPGP